MGWSACPALSGVRVSDFASLSETALRAALRDWLAGNFPTSLSGLRAPNVGEPCEGPAADHAAWKAAVAAAGLGVPTWPQLYGGAGLSAQQAAIVTQEFAAVGAFNPINGLGVMMLGPTLLEFGNEAQKLRHLPPIARGEVVWCQGFSEPGAGSDLAALRTRCEDAGDYWLVNGQKIWTSYAHHADWCFCLVRTSNQAKHRGISFLLIEMRSPGIEVRPITLINGGSHFCEIFFTDVRVPKDNLVGEINAGWPIAKRLLQHERNGLSALRGSDAGGIDLVALVRRYRHMRPDGGMLDADLRSRLADHLMADHAYRLTLERREAETAEGLPGTPTSVLKNLGANIGQVRSEMAMEILGFAGLGWAGEGFAKEELAITNHWLFARCYSIYGGSHEVQNNITALHELNLPKG